MAVGIPVAAFGLPLSDVRLYITRRFMSNRPLCLKDAEHVHHKLLKPGLSHRGTVLVLYAVAAAFGLLSLMLLNGEMMIGLVLLLIVLGDGFGIRQLKYVEFYELISIARRIRIRKQITANNLQIRRAIESFPTDVSEFSDVCRILQKSLEPAGFCGFSITFSTLDNPQESFLLIG